MRSFAELVAFNHHVQGTVLGAIGHAADEPGTGFPIPETEAEKQIQGHVKNEIGVWFSGATLGWSTGQVPTMAEGGWAVVLPAGEPQVLVLVSRRVGGCPPAGSRPPTCQKGTKEHPRPVTEAPED